MMPHELFKPHGPTPPLNSTDKQAATHRPRLIGSTGLTNLPSLLIALPFHLPSEQKPERFQTALSGTGCRREQPKSSSYGDYFSAAGPEGTGRSERFSWTHRCTLRRRYSVREFRFRFRRPLRDAGDGWDGF